MPLLEALRLKPPKGMPLPGAATAAAGVGPGSAPVAAGDGVTDTPPLAPPQPAVQPTAKPAVGAGAPTAQAGAPIGTKPGTSPEQVTYDAERKAVVQLRSALGTHAQAAHVKDQTDKADRALVEADKHAKALAWPQAMAELASARKACEDGKGFADKYAAFLVKYAEANIVLTAASTSGWTGIDGFPPMLANAMTLAAPASRSYVAATKECQDIIDGLAPYFKTFYVDNVKPKIAALKTLAAAKFIAAEIDALDKLLARQEAGITAKEWRQVRLNDTVVQNQLAMAGKIAARRAAFDVERPKADTALKAVQAHGPAVATPLAAIQQKLKDADAMASKAGMQFEDATTAALDVIKACEALDRLARDAAGYTAERGALASELVKLRGHAAAAKIKAELDVVRGLLDEAAAAAGDKGAPGTVLALGAAAAAHDIPTARVKLAQAKANLATARGLAEGLGGVAQMEALLGAAPNLNDARKAVDAIDKELAAAQKAPHADLAQQPFADAKTKIDAARKAIDAKKPDDAAKALAAAGEHLTAGRRLQVAHAEFVARHAALKQRLGQHQANKAQAAKIQARIDAFAKALDDADQAETAGSHAQAMAFLNAAETAAAAADDALVRRQAFDKDANTLALDIEKPVYQAIKTAQSKALTQARALASVFDFDAATKGLKAIRNALGTAEAEAMAKKKPPDPKLAAKAKELVKAGATAEIDDLIKNLDPKLDKQVFIELAQARFDVAFEAEADGHEQASIQRMCALMKDIPDDVIGNPSLKKINRRVTNVDGSGKSQDFPYYAAAKNEVVMNSRPKQWNKPDFEPGATGRLPARDKECEPANTKREDLFDFNMLHELAHSIDDAKNYMGTFGHRDDHGGWIAIGGAVDQIVDAVVAETGFGTSPEERAYVRNRILRNPAQEPATFKGNKAKFEDFVKAAQTDNVWDSQALTDKATLGKRVYHEGYPNTWFSYLAEARKKGITSYQFRAPGEWFSELYAAWKVGKLKSGHPAETWLKKLKV